MNRLPRENASPYRGGKPSLGHLCENFAFAIGLGGPRPAKTFIRIRAILVSQRHDTGPSASFQWLDILSRSKTKSISRVKLSPAFALHIFKLHICKMT